jgi:oligoendopeptidase F
MAVPVRAEVKTEDRWDLTPMFPVPEKWASELERVSSSIGIAADYQGKLGESADKLAAAVSSFLNTQRELEKLYVYAHLESDADLGNSTNLGRLDQIRNLYTRFSALWSFFEPELLALEEKRIAELIADPKLAQYRRMLNEIIRYKPHTLTAEGEGLLALGGEVFGTSGNIFSQLNNVDLRFEPIKVDGVETALSHGTYSVLLKKADRCVREAAFNSYYTEYDQHKHTISASLSGSIKRDIFLAQAKRFPSALARSLFSDNVPESVYNNLIDTVSANLEPLHRYYKLRSQVLKLSNAKTFDTYVPLVSSVSVKHSYEEASELVLESLRPLGEEYTNTLRRGLLAERWADRYENKGKRSGAYSSGCYDSFPYMLLNYKEDELNHVFTLTHEAGHSMHTYFSNRNQPYQDHGYTIFVAEVASTFNEQLLNRSLMARHKGDREMLAYLVNHEIDEIKGTLYRQTMFAEFEKLTHARGESHQPLTLDYYREIYRGLLSKFFGPAIELSAYDELEFLRIPHFYSAFYVYKYATGISAAVALSQMVLNGGAAERERYLGFLKSGGSDYPLEILKRAGVDMTSPQPIETTLKRFSKLVDELEELLA